jgi:uncharacterized protein (TIGR02246 family)
MNASVPAIVLGIAMSTWACGAGAPAAPAGPTAEDRAAVEAIAAAYQTAYNAGDAAGLTALVTDDYETIQPDGTHVTGRAAFQQGLEAQFAAAKASGATVTLTITHGATTFIGGTHAHGHGTYTLAGAAPGQPTSGSYMTVSRKEPDGSWKLTSSLAAPYVPPPPVVQ